MLPPSHAAPHSASVDLADRSEVDLIMTQPFSAVLVLRLCDFEIIQASGNTTHILALPPSDVLGKSLRTLIGDAAFSSLCVAITAGEIEAIVPVIFSVGTAQTLCDMTHRLEGGVLILEMEAHATATGSTAPRVCRSLPFSRFRACHSPDQVCTLLVEVIQQRTGFDNVRIFRFESDRHGAVAARQTDARASSRERVQGDLIALRQAGRIEPTDESGAYFVADLLAPPVAFVPSLMPLAWRRPTHSLGSLSQINPDDAIALVEIGVRASMRLPLRANQAQWGTILCHHSAPLHLSAAVRAECAALCELANFVLEAIGHAQAQNRFENRDLAHANQRTKARDHLKRISSEVTLSKRAAENLIFLAAISRDLLRLASIPEMTQVVGEQIARHLSLSLCAFVEIDEAADNVVIGHDWHRDDVPSLVGTYRLAEFVEPLFIRSAKTGKVIVVRDVVTDPRTDAAKFASLKIAAFICVPLIRHGQWRFSMCMYHSVPHKWREDEIELVRELTARIWTRIERLRAEEALKESEKRYRQLFESIDDGFCIIEKIAVAADALADFLFIEANPAFVVQSGTSGVIGKTIREMFPGISEDWYRTYALVLETGMPLRFQRTLLPADKILECYAFRVEHGTRQRVAISFKDVTERCRAEQAFRVAAELIVEENIRKDEFLAMLGHELRNPLAPIINSLYLLKLQNNEDSLQQNARRIIERQVGQLKRLVDQLVEVSRVTTGRIEIKKERILASAIVERAIETTDALIAQRQHSLTVSLPEQPVWLYADAARLEQVLVNLINNAAKYAEPGGHIWVSIEEQSEAVIVKVRDTGVGIAPELLPQIFGLFTQAKRALDRSQGGLGIGLCLVQKLVELHGGSITATSTPGKGSEFSVRLPRMPIIVPPRSLAAPERRHRVRRHCRVLVVEDSLDLAQTLLLLLQAGGHDVLVVHDGASALASVGSFLPDVVLLDIGLPGMNGLDVAKQIRLQPLLKHVLLVAMTGYGQDVDRQRSEAAGFDHYLVKPVDYSDIEAILNGLTQVIPVPTVMTRDGE